MMGSKEKPKKGRNIPVKIRWMRRADIDDVVNIEEACDFDHPWSRQEFVVCLRRRGCINVVAERNKETVGYLVYTVTEDPDTEEKKLDVLNFVVDPKKQRRSIGTQMTDKLKEKMHQNNAASIEFVVHAKNLVAQLFLKSQGFLAVELLEDYADETMEAGVEVYVMQYRPKHQFGIKNRISKYWDA